MGYPKIAKAVAGVLKTMAKKGQTTKKDATLLAWKKVEMLGGPTAVGVGRAIITVAMLQIIGTEVTRQLKMPLTDHEREFVMPKDIRDDVKEICEKVPAWIAIADGADAIWMHTLKARPEHWEANGNMKTKKAVQTQLKADISTEVALFLIDKGFDSLEQAIRS